MSFHQAASADRSHFEILEGKEIVCARGAVATGPAQAARVGAEILAEGGNAMDAAAAAALACAVLEPDAVDVGGYVFCAAVREGRTGRVWSLESIGAAPHRATERMFDVLPRTAGQTGPNEAEFECSVGEDANVYGPLAVVVPGFLAGLGTLWEKWGSLRWPRIAAPSERLLADGFPYRLTAAAIARYLPMLRRFQPTWQHLMPNGSPPSAEDVWHRPGLETSLRRLSDRGWREFYEGELGRQIAGYVSGIGGILDAEDLARFAPRLEPCYESPYRGSTIYAPRLPCGTLSTVQILNMLECLPADCEDGSPDYWHRLAEVMKAAWQDRLRYFGDPDFAEVPVARFLSKEYAQGTTATLQQFPHALGPSDAVSALPPAGGTIHISAADCAGNMVAATISQGLAFGSGVTVPGTGIILGHGMCRFDPRPGRPNSIAPGKRPLSNIAPLIFSQPDRDVALGTRGGRPIINVCAQIVQRMGDGATTAAPALAAPRLHVAAREPLEFLEFDFNGKVSPPVLDALAAMGHRAVRKPAEAKGMGAAHCVEIRKARATVRATGDTWAAGVS